MKKIRTFVAIDFPDEVVKEVARVQELICKRKFTGKTTELENLHLTLKFLGEIESEMVEEVRRKLREIEFGRFTSRLAGAGIFKQRGAPSIVWIKVGGKGIFELQSVVDCALEKLGFAKEKRFMSHLTVARIKYVKAKKQFIEHISSLSVKSVSFEVKNFKLMSSELKPIGPIYRVIEEFSLA